ncbi:vesicular glutamate transporter 2-like [Clytia hemisphaerica]
MVNSTYAHVKPSNDPECRRIAGNNTIIHNNGKFNWDQSQQGVILSSFFYGYILTQIFGGWVSLRYGGRKVFGWSLMATSILTLLTPVASRISYFCLVTVRVLEGIVQGGLFSALNQLVSQWVAQSQVTSFFVVVYTGLQSGSVVALSTSGYLADSSYGWPSSFYLYGGLSFIVSVLWFIFVYDSPSQHPFISDEEKTYIQKHVKKVSESNKNVRIPWRSMLTSMPVWAIIVGCFSDSWVFTMALGLPTYFEQVLDFKIENDGLLSALPYLGSCVVYLGIGFISDYIRKHHLSTTYTRKLIACFVYFPTAACLIAVNYTGCDNTSLSVALMVMSLCFLALNQGAVTVNQMDISPRYCSILVGITNTSASLAGCLSPWVIGYFTNGNPTREQYRKVFFCAASVATAGGLFCIIFMSGKVQPWNDMNEEKEGESPSGNTACGKSINVSDECDGYDETEHLVRS